MELPRAIRQEYSYSGAVRCRYSSDPQHYHCTFEKQAYFDPSNWVYAMALRLITPKLVQEVEWNNETKGDIVESILGCHYLVSNGLMIGIVDSLAKNCGIVSAIFEAFAWHTRQRCDAVSNEGPGVVLTWVNWISDMVAFRQARDTDIGLMVVQEIPTEFEPRCKRNGHLRSVLVCG